jgi:G3E family GTPase
LRYADTILLNKCDLATAQQLAAVEQKIRTTRDGARIVRTTRCRVALPLILSVGLFQSDQFAQPEACAEHDDCHATHLMNDGFDSVSFEINKPFAAHKFQQFLERLSDCVFRGKGLLWLDASDKRYIFHLVAQRFTLDESRWSEPQRNKLVLIGRNLDRDQLKHQLEACVASETR